MSNYDSAISYLSYLFPEKRWSFYKDNGDIVFNGISNKKISKDHTSYKIPIGCCLDKKPYFLNVETQPHCLIFGRPGSGKTLLKQWILKFLIENLNVSRFVVDAAESIFDKESSYRSNNNGVYTYNNEIELLYNLATIKNIMEDRCKTLKYLNENSERVDNFKFILDDKTIVVNDRIYNSNNIECVDSNGVVVKTASELKNDLTKDEKKQRLYLDIKDNGYIVSTPVSLNRIDEDGCTCIDPIFIFIDEYNNIVTGGLEKEIKALIGKILTLGRSTNIHLFISTQNLEPVSKNMLDSIPTKIVCGEISQDQWGILTNKPIVGLPRNGFYANVICGDVQQIKLLEFENENKKPFRDFISDC